MLILILSEKIWKNKEIKLRLGSMTRQVSIPREVQFVIEKLKEQGFEAYVVGGCVRDLLRGVEPTDWDVATKAKPEEIAKVFPRSFADNKFGTVSVVTDAKEPEVKTIEITPFRVETKYTDKRHPDEVRWARTIEEDLARRDFTVNAMALKTQNAKLKAQNHNSKPKTAAFNIIDPFKGQEDLKNKVIRAVGKPEERFDEDALRLMRAVRFAITLGQGWQIEPETAKAIKVKAGLLKFISKERIRDELIKIIMSERASEGIEVLRQLGLLKQIIPELEEGYGVTQNKHHIYDCYEHSILSLKYAAEKGFGREVRLAALFHDIAKPRVKQGEGPDATFYNHEVIGAKMSWQILRRLRFPRKESEKITKLVRYHLFYYNVDEVGESSVRRLVRKVGPENMEELLQLRQADRIGSGVPKAEPYKLRHLKYLIEKTSRDPISAKMLKISGNEVMTFLDIKPGPKVGQVLDILLGYVLEDPAKNKKAFLEKELKKLAKLSDAKLQHLAEKAREERSKIETKQDAMTKKKYWVT